MSAATHMSSLDSRFLRLGDCYAHRFTRAGVVRCELSRLLLSPGTRRHEREPALTITVREGAAEQGKMKQHNVLVRQAESGLVAEPTHLEIASGDGVLWTADKSVKAGFRIRGAGETEFDSANLTSGSLFTHAFGLAGRYEWRDANGSQLHGEVIVQMPGDSKQECAEWRESLSRGTVVHVSGEHATPAKLEVLVGQTVFWAIERADGVTITDATLLRGGRPGRIC